MVDNYVGIFIFNYMVEYNTEILDTTFAALADPTRRAILEKLAAGEQTVGELAEPFDMSLAAVSKHIHLLTRANLVSQRKEGRIRHCRLEPDTLRTATDWMDFYRQFWSEKLSALEKLLEADAASRPMGKNKDKRTK
ncbi:MAG: metalloregulator ArsR/SmtB family transcription factor [Proteobacteria bacterium]|nr:metalloregulator ArsR/SmtB family transcription factor [Pseudomonadota bacterium]